MLLICMCAGVQASQAERMMMAVAEIVTQLIKSHEEGKDVNLNK